MESIRIQALRECQAHIQTRWETLLRQEQVQTALASPDLLVRMFDGTLDAVFERLQRPSRSAAGPVLSMADIRAKCPCGRNPLLAYYSTAEQVLLETLTKLEAGPPQKPAAAADELRVVIHQLALQEIKSFCSVCQYRTDQSRTVTDPSAI